MSLRDFKTIIERRKFIEEKIKTRLSATAVYPKDLEEAQFKNCENMIGAVQIPLGIAGPLLIQGKYAKGEYYIPLATTEGALVASISRGCKALTLSSGAKVYTENVGMTRGSLYKTNNLAESFRLKTWLEDNFAQVAKRAQATSSHLTLKKIFTKVVGRNVFVRFSFDTQEAMGMNMVTFAAEEVAALIKIKLGIECVALAGNFDIDKKPAWLNSVLGRGRQIWAEATIPKEVINNVLKTTSFKIHEVAVRKCLIGSAVTGSLGFNAHFANIVAAVFLALGQDAAHVVEGSLGITTTELIGKNLYISIYLPALAVGTVGGGTNLPAQRESFEILGFKGSERTSQFAETIGGAVLAGELSLLSSLAEGSLASSHRKLARKNK
jgi:hydroxymethylglutaryl-CoA reductase (NADPH)